MFNGDRVSEWNVTRVMSFGSLAWGYIFDGALLIELRAHAERVVGVMADVTEAGGAAHLGMEARATMAP